MMASCEKGDDIPPPPPIPEGCQPLSHQVAGHIYGKCKTRAGLLQDNNGSILKLLQTNNRGTREKKFYEAVFGENQTNPLLLRVKDLLCPFKGTISTGDPSVEYIKLSDMTCGFKRPCIMDVKIGSIGYNDGTRANAKKAMMAKFKYPHMDKLGFQILGMRVYHPLSKEYSFYDKAYGRSLDVTSMMEGLARFFNVEEKIKTDVMYSILVRLQQILDWFEDQNVYHFYSSSLLFIYEAEPSEHPAGCTPETHSTIPIDLSRRGKVPHLEIPKEHDRNAPKPVLQKPPIDSVKKVHQKCDTNPLQRVHQQSGIDPLKTVNIEPNFSHEDMVWDKPDMKPLKRKKMNGDVEWNSKATVDEVSRNHEGLAHRSKSGREASTGSGMGEEGDRLGGDSRRKLPGDSKTEPGGVNQAVSQGDSDICSRLSSRKDISTEGQNCVSGNTPNGIIDDDIHVAIGDSERHKENGQVDASVHEQFPRTGNKSKDKLQGHISELNDSCAHSGNNDCVRVMEGNGHCPHKGSDHCLPEEDMHCPHSGVCSVCHSGAREHQNGLTHQMTNCFCLCSCDNADQGKQNKRLSGKTSLNDSSPRFLNRQGLPHIEVRMIDFAHAIESTTRDENYIFGLKMLMQYIRTLYDCHVG